MKKILLWINVAAAALVVVGVFAQVYFITSYFAGAGDNALDTHETVGFAVIHPLEAIAFLASIGAYWRAWRWIGWSFLLILFGTVQIILAPPDENPESGWIHGLHGLFALFVALLAAYIARNGWRKLRLTREPDADAGAAPAQPLP
jgi:asparagine N-glycosylation enzyme membrane subunit Stt3